MGVSFKQQEAQEQRVYCFQPEAAKSLASLRKVLSQARLCSWDWLWVPASPPPSSLLPCLDSAGAPQQHCPRDSTLIIISAFIAWLGCEYARISKCSLNLQLVCFILCATHCRLHGFTFLYSFFFHSSFLLSLCSGHTLLDLPTQTKMSFKKLWDTAEIWLTN